MNTVIQDRLMAGFTTAKLHCVLRGVSPGDVKMKTSHDSGPHSARTHRKTKTDIRILPHLNGYSNALKQNI